MVFIVSLARSCRQGLVLLLVGAGKRVLSTRSGILCVFDVILINLIKQ